MDLGSSTFTNFKNDETIARYIADNIELFNCDMGLIHSHNQMSTFFSGTDTATLQSEGNDTNCFVSLIVNNAGTYCAAITRKIKEKKEVTTYYYGKSYEFFGEGEVKIEPPYQAPDVKQKYIDVEAIEYFMLDVEREVVDNPLEYLDDRFSEIEKQKEVNKLPAPFKDTSDKDEEFFNWIHSSRKTSAEAKEALYSQPTLFSKEEMDEMIDAEAWVPDSDTIHHMTAQLITCSLIINKDIDLKQWITRHMVKKYAEIFADFNDFEYWADNITEFMISHTYDFYDAPSEVIVDDETFQSKIAEALIEELQEYPSNNYIAHYINLLNNYIVA